MAEKKEKAGAKAAAAEGKKAAPATDAKKAEAKKSESAAKAAPPRREPKEPPKGVAQGPLPKDYLPRLKKHYDEVVRPALIKEFGYKNPMEVPRIEKIVLNMGVGETTADTKKATVAAGDLALIAGQKPVITRAKKSIATFKVREN